MTVQGCNSIDNVGILIVDDKEENLVAFSAILGDWGLDIVRARSGLEALRCLLARDFAAILLDVHMPGMDGIETASIIRQRIHSENTPILFITAFADELRMARGYALGAVDYILTPVIPEVLQAKVSVFVELHRKTLEVRQQADKLRQRASQLAALATDLSDAEQRERRRLAQILHDNLQQLLAAARMRLGALCVEPHTNNALVLAQVDDLIGKSIDSSRSLTMQLSPPVLYDVGLVAAMEWLGREMVKEHGLAVEVKAGEGADFAGESVRAFVFHAVRELLFNIVKHADVKQARVTLSRAPDNRLAVIVEDAGKGFDPSLLETAAARSRHFGLFSICERVKLMNGRCHISSSPGQGTRIALMLPGLPEPAGTDHQQGFPVAVSARQLANRYESDAPLTSGTSRIQVLLADDHKLVRKGLIALLESQPDIAVVGEAVDGPAVIELAQLLHPHVIVMDVSMPGMSGIEATRRVKQALPDIHVVGLSMHQREDTAMAMHHAGASAYLSKGGPPEALIAEIRNARPPAPSAEALAPTPA